MQHFLRSTVLIAFACAASHAAAETGERPSRPPKRPDDLRSHTNQDRTPPLTLHTNQDSFDLRDFGKDKHSFGDEARPWTVDQSPPDPPQTRGPLDLTIDPFDLDDPVLDALLSSDAPLVEIPLDATIPLSPGPNGRHGWIIVSAPALGDPFTLDPSPSFDPASRAMQTSPVPAPGALSLFGLAAVAAFGRRRRRS